ncbi:(d)CMP kinase [Paenibacillus turpanensis]|uniref:(d)CMP kinase n=1 Tax=Paenibacillus turpanensis TaxID=2689078 RepID=UPI00140D7268|nr:(d)CMP kinase [Paenibacillus turpanensis]
MSIHKLNVAIDGPAGAGKSTISRLVANELGYVYVDTGAMYRSVTWKMLQRGLPLSEQDAIVELARQSDIRLFPHPSGQQVFVDGEDVTEAIRSSEVTSSVSDVAKIAGVRALLVEKQKLMALEKGVVMDGRDIGTNVLPHAEVKVFMTAGVRVRAERRRRELEDKGSRITLEQLMAEISERDRIDQEREVSPLVMADDAILLDTTEMSIGQVVERIIDLCKAKMGGEKLNENV